MAKLASLLDRIIEEPENREDLLRRIASEFSEEKAILILDMSGFTRTTQQYGIATFLLMIHQMKRLAIPAIETAGGYVVKAEADNLYCLFPAPENALQASRDILARLQHANLILPSTRRLYAAIGIGFGDTIVLDHDLFGDEVNLACKLGEDIADAGEILLTPKAKAKLIEPMEAREHTISGVALTYFASK